MSANKDVDFQKYILRDKYKNIRNQLAIDEKIQKDKKILSNILSMEVLNRFSNYLTYISINSEVDTRELIQNLYDKNKSVYAPTTFEDRLMEFYQIQSLSELKKAKYSLLEPVPDEKNIYNDRAGIIIVPGLCFDKKGFRIGYGGGFYDNFLRSHSNLISIGVCYEDCLIKSVPTDKYDVGVDYIVTENNITEVLNE